jgi:predicted nucleic acid-binding Zn ribbon protein
MALWRTGSPPEPHICKECGQGFDVKQKRLYCSQKCVREAHLRRRRDNEYQPPRRDCDVCGTEIPYKSGKRRYCSAKCQKAGIAKEARWRIKGLDPSIAPAESCQLCGATDRRLVIDHDHACCPQEKACGRCVRGMLCQPCNVGLGMFRESPALLHRAARYLEAGKRDLQSGQLRLVV